VAKLDPLPDVNMRCTEPGRNPAQIFTDWLAGGQAPLLGDHGRQTIFTQSGRAAIALAARLWGIASGDEVLVPAYHCGSEISPLIATGARIVMYRIDPRAGIDLTDLLERITPRTRLILVIHYFGQPSDLTRLAEVCRALDIKLLEDCALSLFSDRVGRIGDGAIFSFYKTLPTCAGGALTLRTPGPDGALPPSSRSRTTREMLSLMKKWAKATMPLPSISVSPLLISAPNDGSASPPDMPASYYYRHGIAVRKAPRVTLGALRRADAAFIKRRRRDNFARLQYHLLQIPAMSLLWPESLAADTCPLGLPILVRNKHGWCERLVSAGIGVSPWWIGCHRDLDWSDFPEALALKATLILLPVHQDLAQEQIDQIARSVAAIAAATP
jgi:dTDP-4-amino-4,6-dideoxygalactose transaminase